MLMKIRMAAVAAGILIILAIALWLLQLEFARQEERLTWLLAHQADPVPPWMAAELHDEVRKIIQGEVIGDDAP